MCSLDNYYILVESGLHAIDIDSVIGDTEIINTKDLLDSGPSAIDVDDLTGDGVITITKSRRQGRFPLMRLPTEIRVHIFSFLLPDLKVIHPRGKAGRHFRPGHCKNEHLWMSHRHDDAKSDMAIMRSNRQVYDETANYLYNRLTIVVSVGCDGVDLLSSHWGCGEISGSLFTEIPFNKFKLVWLQIEAGWDQRKHLVHVRHNLLDVCGVLCQLVSPKCVRVDLFDDRHWEADTTFDFHEPTSVQGGLEMVTKDVEYIMRRRHHECSEEVAERKIWRAANSTGTSLAATDIEVILQPLKLLRGVKRCQIFLNPHLQSHDSLVKLAASHEEIVQSKRDLTLADLESVHDVSEELYRLAAFVHNENFFFFHPLKQKRMEHLLWQPRKWHKMPCAPVEWHPTCFGEI